MKSTTHKCYVLVINDKIEAYASDLEGMRFYCCENNKSGKVYMVETYIPFGYELNNIVTTTEYLTDIK